jgi:hypothetical protein
MSVMTASQLHEARMLIPGAFELNAPPHRAAAAAPVVPAAPSLEAPPARADAAHVLAVPDRPTTRLGHAAAILWDLGLLMAIIYGVAVVPALAMWGVQSAATFLATFGRQ